MRALPTWFTSRFASACGRWLVSATIRSWASGSTAVGTAPSATMKRWSASYRAGSVRARGEEPGLAQADDRPGSGAFRRQAERGTDQAGADDREPLDGHSGRPGDLLALPHQL